MGNNHHHFSSVFKKIFGAICSTFHKNHHHEQDYSAPAAVPNHHHRPHHSDRSNSYTTQSKPSANGIPGRATPPKRAKATSQEVQARHIPNLDYYNVSRKENSGSGVEDINDAFSDYINRAKIKIRAVSNVGCGEEIVSWVDNVADTGEEDDVEDEFSSYINRAKLRIRKTSSINGSRNMISFKRE